MKTPIKDFYGRVLGFVEDDAQGNKTYRDFYNRIVGYYRKKENVTLDFYQRVVARGDTGSALVYQANAEEEAKRNRR